MRTTLALTAALFMFACACAGATVLDDLAMPRDYTSGRVSSYDTYGGNGDGGQGHPLKVGELRTIVDITGPGEIAHVWFTLAPFDKDVLANVILRMYWDGEKTPSVEAPIGAFFGLGHGKEYSFDSLPISVGNNRGLNCFFPMPFSRRAKVIIENQSSQQLWALYYYFDYKRFDKPTDDLLYFHAQYRQAKPELSPDNYVALDAKGRGHYVGMFYYIRSNSGGWWGEGDDQFFIDGSKLPTLYGTGMEDYFCNAWGMKQGQTFARFGAPLFEVYMTGLGNENTAYRWHLEDAIAFRKSIRVTHEHGSNNDRNDDFSSVAFWYQTHPHAAFPPLPSKFERLSFADKKRTLLEDGKFEQCRAVLQDFVDRAVDAEARTNAMLEIAETYITQGDKPKAAEVLNSYLGPMPLDGWTNRVREVVERNGLRGVNLPTGDVTVVISGDGRAPLMTVGGAKGYGADPAEHSPFLYFKVTDKDLRDSEKNLVLDVEYYTHGPAKLAVEYNSAFEGDDVFVKYHKSEVLDAPGAGWRTARIELPRAKLVGSQNSGADVRLVNLNGPVCVRSARVSAK